MPEWLAHHDTSRRKRSVRDFEAVIALAAAAAAAAADAEYDIYSRHLVLRCCRDWKILGCDQALK